MSSTTIYLHLRALLLSLATLTRLPIGGFPYTRQEIRWSAAYFPLAGSCIGLLLALIYSLLLAIKLQNWAAAVITIATSLIITGAYHEDGLADTADALGGGQDTRQILRILKDSRVGTFGGAALCISLIGRIWSLAELPAYYAPAALILIETISRVPPIIGLSYFPYVTQDFLSKSKLIARSKPEQSWLACGWGLLFMITYLLFGLLTIGGFIGIIFIVVILSISLLRYFIRRIGGVTGDFLGALQQIVALALWLIW